MSSCPKAVIAAGEKESGITIHYVNENFDEGKIIHQIFCKINKEDNAESLSKMIHIIEYQHYPVVIEKILLNQTPSN